MIGFLNQGITDISITLSHFACSAQLKEYELDGKQTFMVSLLACSRLRLLGAQFEKINPYLETGFIRTSIIIGLGTVVLKVAPWALKYYQSRSPKGEEAFQSRFKWVSSFIDSCNQGLEKISKKMDLIVNLACLTSYVAFIALGFVSTGLIGLTGLLLIAIKQQQGLPSIIEKNLDLVLDIAKLLTVVLVPLNISLRVLVIIIQGIEILKKILGHEKFYQILPEEIKNVQKKVHLKPSLFKIKESIEAILNDPSLELQNTNFEIIESFVHAQQSHFLIPPEKIEEVKSVDPQKLFEDIEKRLGKQQFPGLQKIKQGVIEGKIADVIPPNLENMQCVMKCILRDIFALEDPALFQQEIENLSNMGDSCVKGWFRGTLEILNPSSKNLEWNIYYYLARDRSFYLLEELTMLRGKLAVAIREGSEIFDDTKEKKLADLVKLKTRLDLLDDLNGGHNNVHLINNIERVLLPEFNSLQGALYLHTHPYSFFEGFAIKRLNLKKHFKLNSLLLTLFFDWPPHEAACLEDALFFVEKYFENSQRLIDIVYQLIEEDKIPKEAINGWLEKMQKKGYDSLSWSKEKGLTKQGVAILLCDLGILSAKTKTVGESKG